jgi:Flp pilus assembly protein TadD
MNRTALTTALVAIYAVAIAGLPSFGRGSRFDPLAPRPRVVERMLDARQFPDAEPLAIQLRDEYPREPLVEYWIAAIEHGLRHDEAEVAAWEAYVALSPTPEEACPGWPEAYARLGRVDRALAAFERCASIDAKNPDRLIDLAAAYERASRLESARDAYRRAAALDDGNPVAQSGLDRLAATSGRSSR